MTTNITTTTETTTVVVEENIVRIELNNIGVQGIPGVGYTGVTSTSNIAIGAGLKTFTLVSGYQGAFITGMRIRAIHSDTPTYYLEGTANYVGAGTLIITVDKFNGSGSHNLWQFASAGEVGQTGATGATGASGVIAVTSPITNTGSASSAIVGIDQTLLSITRSQVSDFTSGTVASAGTAQQAGTATYATTSGTAVFSTNSGTATYATTSGTAVNISGTVTQSQVTNLTSDLALKAPLASPTFSGTVTLPFASSGLLVSGTAGAITKTDAAPDLGYFPSTGTGAAGYVWNQLSNYARRDQANAFTVGGHTITNDAVGTVPLRINTVASQTADVLQLRTSTSGALGSVNYYGRWDLPILTVGATSELGRVSINTAGSTTIGAVIRGAASQSADLQQWQDSTGSVKSYIDSNGRVMSQTAGNFGGLPAGSAFLGVQTQAGVVGLLVKSAASQTANLQEYQNSGGTVLGGRNAVGQAWTGSTVPIRSAVGGTIQSIATGANPLVTMASAHNLAVGDLVTLASTTSGTYDGTFVIGTVPATTTFTITTALTTGQAGAAGTVSVPAQKSITARSAGTRGLVIRGAASQNAALVQLQDNGGTTLMQITSAGNIQANSLQSLNGRFNGSVANSGGQLSIVKQTAIAANPGADVGRIYFRDGTTAGTLKLVVRAGAAGAETTILDNIPQ